MTLRDVYAAFQMQDDPAADAQFVGFTVQSMAISGGAQIRAEMRALGYEDPGRLTIDSPELLEQYRQFALDQSTRITLFYNELLQSAVNRFPPDTTVSEAQTLLQPFFGRVDKYNHDTLFPYARDTARQMAVSAFYDANTSPQTLRSLTDTVEWIWTRGSGSSEPDSCADAEDASPAPRDDLVNIAGEPPVHQNCQCSLDPDDIPPDDLPALEDVWTGQAA